MVGGVEFVLFDNFVISPHFKAAVNLVHGILWCKSISAFRLIIHRLLSKINAT